MSRVSPTLEGFRAAFRRPSLTLAEMAWRWIVGALAWALLFFWAIEYLGTLPVTNVDATLLSTRQPLLVGQALAHILHGSLNRAVLAALFAAVALALLWIFVASIGRAATVRALLDYFREGVANAVSTETSEAKESRVLRSLIGLNFLRAALTLAAMLAFVGAAILVSLVSSDANPHPGLAFVLFLLLAGVICIAWPALNWLLSLATVFAVRDGEDALGALSAAVIFSQERSGPVAAVSTWTGLAHLAAFVGASTLASLPLAFLQIAPVRLVIAAVILVTLGYFAIADWLYMARLAGYVCIAEMLDGLVSSAPLPAPPTGGQQFAPAAPAQTTIDHDEPILSDLPLSDLPAFAVQT
jgi:hypothetical protein